MCTSLGGVQRGGTNNEGHCRFLNKKTHFKCFIVNIDTFPAPVTRPIPPQSCATKQPTIQSSQTVNHVNNHKIVTNGKNNALCDEEENVQIDEPPLSPSKYHLIYVQYEHPAAITDDNLAIFCLFMEPNLLRFILIVSF